MKVFVDTETAAQMVGLTSRHFMRKFVEAEGAPLKGKDIMFKRSGPQGRGAIRRRMFLRTDVEKLK